MVADKSIFTHAAAMNSLEERARYLDEVCGDDKDLRVRIERLLAAYDDPQCLLDLSAAAQVLRRPSSNNASPGADHGLSSSAVPPWPADDDSAIDFRFHPGEKVGPYTLLEKLGEGGFGIVYKAQQSDALERQVALKIIKQGMDSRQVIARFEAERQALAMMDHPGIAKVYDAGATESGRPYFAMELVSGLPINVYCDQQRTTIPKRLELFVLVCRAVQHAHQKGIIHRDLKPNNVLVARFDGHPLPKVIDFGIAKATDHNSLQQETFTRSGQVMGTLEYMSPEQAGLNPDDIDTRSDIYSLGVILYELLTGKLPFEPSRFRKSTFDEALRIIREEDPPRPSARLSKEGPMSPEERNSSVQRRRQTIRGDLDWIAMKALEKNRNRRYSTANELADDVQRFIDDQPVIARPPTPAYRVHKFVRRHRARLLSAALLLACVLIPYAVYDWMNDRIQEERMASDSANGITNLPADDLLDEAERLPLSPRLKERLETLAPFESEAALNARIMLLIKGWNHDWRQLVWPFTTENPDYMHAIIEALRSHMDEARDTLWSSLHDETRPVSERFRAAIVLATYDPDSDQWRPGDFQFIAKQLLRESPENQAQWRNQLAPINRHMWDFWEQIFFDPGASAPELLGSAYALGQFVRADAQRAAGLLSRASPDQYHIVFPLMTNDANEELLSTLGKLAQTPPPDALPPEERVEFGKARAGAAITLLRLAHTEDALAIFTIDDDPEALSQFAHGCRKRGVTADELLSCLDKFIPPDGNQASDTVYPIYGLLLALGNYSWEEIPAGRQDVLLNQLVNLYQHDPRSIIHSVCGWLLREWKQHELVNAIDHEPVPMVAQREWFTLAIPAGHPGQTLDFTFVVFPPGEYEMGSPNDEPERNNDSGVETRHTVRITRPFALLDREVTYEELLAWNEEHAVTMKAMWGKPGSAGPGTMWYESVTFCRWLTAQRGLSESDQVYPDTDSLSVADYPRDEVHTTAPKNWPCRLSCTGFRLPTEAEWEIACRSGMRTTFGFGGDPDLLRDYAWYGENSNKLLRPPKQLRPNLRGLFDMHGNLFEWCHDWAGPYPSDIRSDPTGPAGPGDGRVLRGGCYGVMPALNRCANRMKMPPSTHFVFEGIRLCMTLPGPGDHNVPTAGAAGSSTGE